MKSLQRMSVRTFCHTFGFLVMFLFCLLASPTLAQALQWRPAQPAELALKAPAVEKDADAEALLWEVYINDSSDTTDFTHYVRIKIFTDRGKDSQSKIDIPYLNGVSIKDIAGRTIKPDGAILELKKDAVFEREIVKFGKLKLKAKSFAMPGIEPGSIIEYRWREVHENGANYIKMDFQRDVPVQLVRYYLKPDPRIPYAMKTITYHGKPTQFVKTKDGFWVTEMTNMPALHEEPQMPPEDQVKAWMLVYYAPDVTKPPAEYWKDKGKQMYEVVKGYMKVNDDVRKASAEAIGDATAPEQKLERLFNYSRAKVKNITDDASGLTPDQLKKMKENKSAADALKRGYGTGEDIDIVFAALATAAGFEARYALCSDRSKKSFDPQFTNTYFLRMENIAVKMGDQWHFFHPGNTYVPFGMLTWWQEDAAALVTDPKEPLLLRTPVSPASKSIKKRTAKLKLSEDGTLEGEVRIEYTGHFAVEMKEENDDESAEQRDNRLRASIKKQFGAAELADIKIENVTDPIKPFIYSYKIRVAGYAERTGKRLFLQPAFFQKGFGAMFPTNTRQTDIDFHYPWSEDDYVTIDLPPGYLLDNADQPGAVNFGQSGSYQPYLGITKDLKTLEYKRKFTFNLMAVPQASYGNLKAVFDAIHQSDNHAVTLKQAAAAAKQ